MKTRYLDRVIAAGHEARSVALATDLASGAQLLLDGDRFDGELALADDRALDAAARHRADKRAAIGNGKLGAGRPRRGPPGLDHRRQCDALAGFAPTRRLL